ncbi:MAG: carboxynorspermidine decarboxylase [Kiritimatiellae bacterium]|nr:carboxynorspermidine decarboxylase [Kiritimatiellia bacterium]
MDRPATPYYLIREKRLLANLRIIARVREQSGARAVLALKCFAGWSVFGLLRKFLDGTTSSSPYEARLGRETFGKEVHAYSVGFSREDVRSVRAVADKVIFNSVSQLRRFHREVRGLPLGIRVNPGLSYSHFDLADPARRYSRLGVADPAAVERVLPLISGVMFHFNCENDDFPAFARALDALGRTYGPMLRHLDWVSLGGGLAFTDEDYPLDAFCRRLKRFGREFGVQVYLEPGDAVVAGTAELVTTVLDVVRNEQAIAIVDASTEAHMLDHLIYRTHAKVAWPRPGRFRVIIAGRSCLAGDVFGTYRLRTRLKPGSVVRFAHAGGYTMVKKNWFNGLAMPSICVKRLDGTLERVRHFGYKDYRASLS